MNHAAIPVLVVLVAIVVGLRRKGSGATSLESIVIATLAVVMQAVLVLAN